MEEVKLGKYRHYKGYLCLVLGVGKHSETLEDLVFYVCFHDNDASLWARPKGMFLENVVWEGKKVPRFKYLGM